VIASRLIACRSTHSEVASAAGRAAVATAHQRFENVYGQHLSPTHLFQLVLACLQ
jgi:transcription initiation factor TFIIIB Brf1 subunit/transcription initiation factor TFIIB